MDNPPRRISQVAERAAELAFAARAALYLERKGLDDEAVVRCLMKEFDLDRKTAQALTTLAA